MSALLLFTLSVRIKPCRESSHQTNGVTVWYRSDIIRQFRRSIRDERDVHSRLMAVYPEVPSWWYAGIGAIALVFGLIAIEVYDTGLPVWALAVSLLIGFIFVIPIGIIRAVTNQLFTINVFAEFFGGYLLHNNPVAVMLFKTYAFVPTTNALTFVSDLKIGHYMKIPPRTMFMAQTISTIIGGLCMTLDRKSTRLNSSHSGESRMPSSA